MTTKRSLLEKYEIPISHLDFKYIDECYHPKEIERIVTILRSGQEGYFPDLTKHAEDKLCALKPDSKVLRTEVPLLRKSLLEASEWKDLIEPMQKWIGDVRKKDRILSTAVQEEQELDLNLPPVRKETQIDPSNLKNESQPEPKPKQDRIKSIEYNKWDKYDADTEILKMDLEEERAKEEIERKNRINLKKSATMPSVSIDNRDVDKLTEVEKEHLSLRFKDRGNDFFRAKDFKEALQEYTKCIQVKPTINGFNNRALAYLKLNDFEKSIDDCNSCLEIDPQNIKARQRKALGYLGLHKKKEAYNIFQEILFIDPENTTAINQLKELEKHLPPDSATRIRIIEEESISSDTTKSSNPLEVTNALQNSLANGEKLLKNNTQTKDSEAKLHKTEIDLQQRDDEDFSKLILPNKIVKSKLKAAVQAMGSIQKQTKAELQAIAKQNTRNGSDVKITLDTFTPDTPKKSVLIEEI